MVDLASQIANVLSKYTGQVSMEVEVAALAVAKELLVRIKSAAPRKTGDYRKKMRLKTVKTSRYNKKHIWHVAAPEYRLTHLLENGHATKSGSVVPGTPHIKPAEEWAVAEFEKRVKKAIDDAAK